MPDGCAGKIGRRLEVKVRFNTSLQAPMTLRGYDWHSHLDPWQAVWGAKTLVGHVRMRQAATGRRWGQPGVFAQVRPGPLGQGPRPSERDGLEDGSDSQAEGRADSRDVYGEADAFQPLARIDLAGPRAPAWEALRLTLIPCSDDFAKSSSGRPIARSG